MSGHSKWHSIKHKKAAVDAKRGKIFTKYIKEIQVAARMGGGDLEANPRLRTVVFAAKAVNMPKDNIEKAIKKGTGELEGVNYEERTFEGYGPAGIAILVETLTDNNNRTTGDIRHIFSKYGGNLGSNGSVSYLFERKGIMILDSSKYKEEEIFEMIVEADAENIETDEDEIIITTSPENFDTARKILEEHKIEVLEANVVFLPKTKTELDVETAKKVLRIIDKFEDNDDVQNVYHNAEIPEEAEE